jgi:hypothetical protein
VEAIADLPMLNDIDADYSPQYVKLARILRSKIKSGHYEHGDPIPAANLVHEHKVSIRVARAALAMLAANRYVTCPAAFRPYTVTWKSARDGGTAPPRRASPARRVGHRGCEHPGPAPALGVVPGEAR